MKQKNGGKSYFYGKQLLGAWSFDWLPGEVVSGVVGKGSGPEGAGSARQGNCSPSALVSLGQ